jgi:hypothetical protein
MHKAYLALAGAAMLTACGQSTKESAAVTGTVSLKNATQAEVGEQVAAANGGGAMFTPGHWEGTVKITDMAMPGMGDMPPAVAAQLKARMAQGHGFSSCLTPDEAADARRTLAKNQNGDCSYDHFTMAGGSIDAAMTCKEGTALRKMTMTGSYTKTDYKLVSQMSGGGGQGPDMNMKMEIAAHRTRDCAPGEKGSMTGPAQ